MSAFFEFFSDLTFFEKFKLIWLVYFVFIYSPLRIPANFILTGKYYAYVLEPHVSKLSFNLFSPCCSIVMENFFGKVFNFKYIVKKLPAWMLVVAYVVFFTDISLFVMAGIWINNK